jgi:hypothetical protein
MSVPKKGTTIFWSVLQVGLVPLFQLGPGSDKPLASLSNPLKSSAVPGVTIAAPIRPALQLGNGGGGSH